MVKLYIAEVGLYENTCPSGVFATPELAMAAHDGPGVEWTRIDWAGPDDVPSKYSHLHSGRYSTWQNNRDWDAAVRITEIDFIEEGPARTPDVHKHQVYREADGGWDYVDGPRPVAVAA